MGNLQAAEMARLAHIDQALTWHLQANHYPPVSAALVPACKQAIKNARAGKYEAMVTMPEGYPKAQLATRELMEGLHLYEFINSPEVY